MLAIAHSQKRPMSIVSTSNPIPSQLLVVDVERCAALHPSVGDSPLPSYCSLINPHEPTRVRVFICKINSELQQSRWAIRTRCARLLAETYKCGALVHYCKHVCGEECFKVGAVVWRRGDVVRMCSFYNLILDN